MALTPERLTANDPTLAQVLTLIHDCFAGMEGRISPASSVHDLTLDRLNDLTTAAEVWRIGTPPIACVILTPRETTLYIGKMAVHPAHRGHGLARSLIILAHARAQAHNLPTLELETRIELTENHATFRSLGFTETARTAHKGFATPTSLTFQKPA